ncbi:winged helix-turn-helix transcriptional regulator [Novosphingobium aureum]|uniref:winged helix-turn-helix transcriptional regulator n=1 Tax=Novosphingobium aureum TaxID=2792964 RepID=UPI002B489BD3|nr:helix-turn-helix domain-containing protein [Novosphingobium aureum]
MREVTRRRSDHAFDGDAQACTGGHRRWYREGCALAFALELVGERWTLLIVRELMLGPCRFNELRLALPGISAKVLTERLDGLEGRGILGPVWLPPPLAVSAYALSPKGAGLAPVLRELVRWAWPLEGRDGDLPLTPVSLMLALHALVDPELIGDLAAWIVFEVAERRFAARLTGDGLDIHPCSESLTEPDLHFRAPRAVDYLSLFTGKVALGDEGCVVTLCGDRALAGRVIDLMVRSLARER